jgi:hypothetical protein
VSMKLSGCAGVSEDSEAAIAKATTEYHSMQAYDMSTLVHDMFSLVSVGNLIESITTNQKRKCDSDSRICGCACV